MFGFQMHVNHKGVGVLLRPLHEDEVRPMAIALESFPVLQYTNMQAAPSVQSEMEWFEKTYRDQDSLTWAIVPDESEEPVGITSLHDINNRDFSCTSGCIIWYQNWWGRGVASAAHLARTYFAATERQRYMIESTVHEPNIASQKALERVGYSRIGFDPTNHYRSGRYIGKVYYKWFNPDRTNILFPVRVPQEYREAIYRAERALELARKEVQFP